MQQLKSNVFICFDTVQHSYFIIILLLVLSACWLMVLLPLLLFFTQYVVWVAFLIRFNYPWPLIWVGCRFLLINLLFNGSFYLTSSKLLKLFHRNKWICLWMWLTAMCWEHVPLKCIWSLILNNQSCLDSCGYRSIVPPRPNF